MHWAFWGMWHSAALVTYHTIFIARNIAPELLAQRLGTSIGNKVVQEVVAGRLYYRCDGRVVITTSTFISGARVNAAGNSCKDG